MNWQPIETAPIKPFRQEDWYMNACRCLIWTGGYVDIGHYGYTQRGVGRWKNSNDRVCIPTHWMPLPERPAA